MRRTLVFGAGLLCFVLGTGLVTAEPLDDARKLLTEKKYGEVDKVLEKDLAVEAPRPEVLRVSLDAALAEGRFMTAERRIAPLLKATENKDLELLYLGAETAERIGDFRSAMNRFLAYAQQSEEKNPKTERALRYILSQGVYPAEYRKYIRLFSATSRSWQLGSALLDRLLAIPDAPKALDLSAFLLAQFPAPANVNYVHWRLRTASDNFELGKDAKDRLVAPVKVMVKGAPSDYQHMEAMFRAAHPAMSDEERLDAIFALQTVAKAPLGGWFMEVFFSMRELPKNEAKLKWGKDYLALEPLYAQSPNRDYYAQFLRVVAESPQVFNIKDKALISAAEIQQKFDACKAKFADNPPALQGLVNYIQNYYLAVDPAARNAFLRKNLDCMTFDQLNEYMRLINYENFDTVLADYAKGKGFKGALDAKVQALPLFNQLTENLVRADVVAKDAVGKAKAALDLANEKAKDQVPAAQEAFTKAQAEAAKTAAALNGAKQKYGPGMLDTARNYMSGYPGNFNWQHMRQHFFATGLVDPDPKLALLGEICAKGGYSGPMQALLNDLANDKANWGNQPKFQEIKKTFEAKPQGTDALMRAQINSWAQTNDQTVHDASKAFLTEYKGPIPGGWEKTQNLQDLLVYGIFDRHAQHMWNNAGGIYAMGELWAPRLGLGSVWEGMARRIREHNGMNALFKIAPSYVALTKAANDNGSPAAWSELSNALNPKNNFTPIFAEAYAKMGANTAALYIYNQREAWADKPQVLVAELDKIVATPGAKITNRWLTSVLIQGMWTSWIRPDSKAPPRLVTALWDALLADEQKSGVYDSGTEANAYGIYVRSGLGKEAGDFLTAYLTLIKQRSALEQIDAITSLFRHVNLPAEAQPGQLQPGLRYNTILNVYKPLLEQLPPANYALVTIHQNIHNEVDAMIRTWPEGEPKKSALALANLMVNMFIEGAPFDGTPTYTFALVDFLCRKAIQEGNWPEVSRLCTFYAGILSRDGNWDTNYNGRILPIVQLLEEKKAGEIVYTFISTIEKKNTPPENVSKQLSVVKARAGSQVPNLIPVDRNDPTYDLYSAAQYLALSNEEKAWELTAPKLKLLTKESLRLDPDYVSWCVEQMRKQKMLQDALDLCFGLLLTESDFAPEVAARICLTKGDIYRDMGNYQAARIEYEGLKNNGRYSKTPAGSRSTYRLIDLLILTKDYSSATTLLERLVDSDSIQIQADAYYYYAKIAYQEGQYKESKEYLKKVKERVMDQVEAAFLEGELNLLLPGGLQYTEVAVGNPRLSIIVIPGRILTLKLQDQNLSVARSGAAIPVVISTSKGGDEEHVKLLPSSTNKNLFTGQITTALGKVVKNNTQLEVRGDDVVSYEIEPEFQKANSLSYPPKKLEVISDARLVASSGEILTEEEEEKRALERQIQRVQRSDVKRFDEMRDNRTVRPGGKIYVQVTDLDMDMSDLADTLPVALKTTSGDILEGFKLTETDPHSGIFRGIIPTGIPLPKATSSDGAEGTDPSCTISTLRNEAWTSVGDGKKPKWLEVDTMTSQLMKSCSIEVPDTAVLKQVRLLGMLADDFEELASYPERGGDGKGGLTVDLALDQRGEHPDAIRRYLTLNPAQPYWQDKTAFDRNDTPLKGRDGWLTSRVRGTFWLPAARALELRFTQEPSPNNWQHAYLFIDGDFVLGGQINAQTIQLTRKIDLVKGAHKFEILVRDHWGRSRASIGYIKDDGTVGELPADWFSTKASPALAEFLKPKGKITVEANKLVGTLSAPTRLRKLRWVFEDYAGNAVSVRKMNVVDAQGTVLIPVKEDFTAGTKNATLEIAPGDQATVTYRDDKQIRQDSSVMEATLNASFFNGSLMLANEEIGVRGTDKFFDYLPARRCRVGDSLMVVVTDYDLDVSAQRDTVDVTVKTTSGETLTVKALEDAPNQAEERKSHSGVFFALVKIGNQTQNDTIKVVAGDRLTASYVDSENTVPGIPVERNYKIVEAGSSKPEFLVYRTNVRQVEDTSDEARAKIKKLRTKDSAVAIIYKDLVIASHPAYEGEQSAEAARPAAAPATAPATAPAVAPAVAPAAAPKETVCSVNAPLVFEVNYPKMALNFGSVLTIEAVAESEVKAAAKENRAPVTLKVPMQIQNIDGLANIKGYPIQLQTHVRRTGEEMLQEGSFSGVIRLQIGSPGDTIDDMVTRGEKQFAANERQQDREGLQYRVPTMLVSGSDTVHLKVKDEEGGTFVTTNVRLLSDARLELLDSTYTIRKEAIYLGEKFQVKVTDPDQDVSNELDKVRVKLTCSSGDQVTMELSETLAHSGIFSGSIKPEFVGEKVADKPLEINKQDNILSVGFGDTVTFEYVDLLVIGGTQPVQVVQKGSVYRGSDAEVACFSKRFKDPEMAVKTRFLTAEALFEMAKEHRKLKQVDVATEEIATGKRILEEAMRDYPDTTLVSQGEFLLANLAQELENYQEAIGRYSHVISTWPESEYAARSQFKKALCLEKMNNYDLACEEYVKVTYIYPENSLVADATVRLGNYYYKKESYKVAAQIFHKFQIRNPTHALAPKALFLAAQCWYKMKDYNQSVKLFSALVDQYLDDKPVREEAMYWLGDSYFNKNDYVKAYQTFKKLTWDYPEGRWAKIARGRLTEEAFSRIEEGS